VKEFITAAADSIGNVDEEEAVKFLHDGREVKFYKPSSGQAAIMMTMGGREMNVAAAGTFIQLFLELMDEDTRRYFSSRLLDRNDPFSNLKGEGGLFDIWETLMEEWSARPTKQPSDFQPSRRATGRSSTGSTRAKGSTSSRSRSTASSR
jgi:hypothetical protein